MASNISGVEFKDTDTTQDEHGALVETYRSEWYSGESPIQWNSVKSLPGVLRGVHCHTQHDDIITVTQGELVLGLIDARIKSPTYKIAELHYCPARMNTIRIPTGVAHGFYFQKLTIMAYAVTKYWSLGDELGCKWDDPDIEINWPCTNPILSERDKSAGTFSAMSAVISQGNEQTEYLLKYSLDEKCE